MVDFIYTSTGRVVCYTDGACRNNGKKNAAGGVGVAFGPRGHPWNYAGPVEARRRPTNNIAEIEAAINGINIAGESGEIDRLTIRTDSRFLVVAYYHYFKHWKRNGWRTINDEPVKNTPQFKALIAVIRCYSDYMHVQFKHIKGHNGDEMNEEADRLAKIGVGMYFE